MIAHGVTDLQTPYMMSRYIKEQMPTSLGDRISLKLYAGGHMLYLHPDSRHHLHDDALAFYTAATGDDRRQLMLLSLALASFCL